MPYKAFLTYIFVLKIGINDGRYTENELTDLIKNNEGWVNARNRLLTADLLIIDEASMLSAYMLKQVQYAKIQCYKI